MPAPSKPDHAAGIGSPPEAWEPARRAARRLVQPIERFLHVEAASGVVLFVSALIAMLWANSPWHASYHALWHLSIGFHLGSLSFAQSLHFLVNDGLMVIFFFVVGLEIRREMHAGELSDMRRATMPIVAAVGGMLVPAAIYLSINAAPSVRHGWGVPMATDIAFAVGVLALLGPRVPPGLRVLLLALAIIDDIGAILVIAVFYSSGIVWPGLALAALGVLLVVGLQSLAVRRPIHYIPAGIVVWTGFHWAGVHPTMAGVVLGLLTPVQAWFGPQGLLSEAGDALRRIESAPPQVDRHGATLMESLGRIERARREAVSPLTSLEDALHPWVAYVIMPLFALANAGVTLGSVDGNVIGATTIVAGVALGLALGKPIGVLAASYLAVRLGVCSPPRQSGWRGVLVVGCAAGVGFTMALFIAQLAFRDPGQLALAKLAILGASLLAGVAALLAGLWLLPRSPSSD